MSDILCFVCSTTVHAFTDELTRETYRDVIGIHLSPDSQLCYVCSHILNKLALFKTMCWKRSSFCPPVLSEISPIKLQKSDLEIHILCPERCYEYKQVHSNTSYQFNHLDDCNDTEYYDNDNEYTRNDTEYIIPNDVNSHIEYNDKDTQYMNDVSHNSHNHIEQHNAIEQFDYANMTDYNADNGNRNCIGVEFQSDNFNDKNLINPLYESGVNNEEVNKSIDAIINDDYANIYDNKIVMDSENVCDTNANHCDNFKIDSNTDSKNSERKEEDSKAVKKSKKKSTKILKRIILSMEQQKAELEANRKEKKYIEAEFKCYNCALSFLFKDTYQAHMMRHEESNGEYQCTTCTLRFASPASLRLHVASHTQRYLCRQCGETLKPRAKRRHPCLEPAPPQSAACHLCGNLLKDANGLQQHLRRVHASRSSGRRYACNVCGDSYERQEALRTHMIKHITRKFHCDQCPATYSSPYTLTQHKRTRHATHAAHAEHVCHACGARYATRKSLLAHVRDTSDHAATTYECPICSRVCPNEKSLASHIQCVHSARKDYACSQCPARYTNRKSLVRHVASHTRLKPHRVVICHLCGNSFKDNSKLNRHLREACKKTREENLVAMYD